jgi:Caspase domain
LHEEEGEQEPQFAIGGRNQPGGIFPPQGSRLWLLLLQLADADIRAEFILGGIMNDGTGRGEHVAVLRHGQAIPIEHIGGIHEGMVLGHGMQFEQTNYLLPVDSKMANEYDAIHGNISAQEVIAILEARAKVVLVFLDACRNNPIEEDFKRRLASSLGRGFGETRGLAPMTSGSSETLVVFATRPNERADDGAGRHSPFTQAFLEHIATPGEDIELVMRDVTASVRAKTNGHQTPQRLTELEHGVTLVPSR